ncbi:MAG: prepilin-type N- cleavage/methylation domain protein [SAR86 cluster bacterium SAR86B]|jgi:type II secretion system protein J|uniref:Type II secretion system protein J n=1 Tax=SAR86 cluster bacterium SAR86B TaxID=1123867 RepID=J5KB02_9GAMM|nr:MAG: prepilin-type N- cleavage/methylation domain protein [SAR86 cluster bacterium SAR86B]|tara:strand:- start:94 stop:687 length:594 start_codon:yes stop_codon:yes gene_type:complete
MNKGFTLIEIIISLIILSIILLISSNLLKSSINYQEATNLKLKKINELNLASTIIRRDLRQAVNVPSRDFFGNKEKGTFNGDYANKSVSFNSYINDISINTSPIKKILYFSDDNTLYRRQYFSSSPYKTDDYFESALISNVSDVTFTYMHERRWHNSWPVGEITSRKIPSLVRVDFKINNNDYYWLIEPDINNVYQQ